MARSATVIVTATVRAYATRPSPPHVAASPGGAQAPQRAQRFGHHGAACDLSGDQYRLPTGSIVVRRPPGADRRDPQAAQPTSSVRHRGHAAPPSDPGRDDLVVRKPRPHPRPRSRPAHAARSRPREPADPHAEPITSPRRRQRRSSETREWAVRLPAWIPPPALPEPRTGSVDRVSPALCVPRPATRTEPPTDALSADV
jgi:hypothetical protein